MPKNRMLEGSLMKREDMTDDCWSTPNQFADLLIQKMGINFPVRLGEDFIVYGFQTPGEDEKGKLWVKTDRAEHFSGFFIFIEGKWQRIYNHSVFDVVWKHGDSREIEPGFQLIDGTVQSIPVEVQQHIMGFYRIDPANSVPLFPVYNYFATIYLGI